MIQDNDITILNNYFKLKNEFDKQLHNMKKPILSNHSLRLKEKRTLFRELKPQCINCKQPSKIGTLFSINGSNENYRAFKITCGNVTNPCLLHIEFHVYHTMLLNTIITETMHEIDTLKNNIIEIKNKLLFGLILKENALKMFETISDDITEWTNTYYNYLNMLNNIVNNIERKIELEDSIKLAYHKQNEIKENIVKMNKEMDDTYATEIARIYCIELEPLFNKIRQLKYSVNTIQLDSNTNIIHLIQQSYTIKELEDQFMIKSISNNLGVQKQKQQNETNTTTSNTSNTSNTNSSISISNTSNTDYEDEDEDEDKEQSGGILININ